MCFKVCNEGDISQTFLVISDSQISIFILEADYSNSVTSL